MIRRAVMAAKRLVRPLVPDTVMARLRLRQHSRMIRNNVDIYESERSSAKRWLKLTPDTYRVVSGSPPRGGRSDSVSIGSVDPELADFLGWHGSELVVRGVVNRPSMAGMRVVEPVISPLSIVTSAEVLAELPVDESTRAEQVLTFAIDAGRRIGLIPEMTREQVAASKPRIERPAIVVLSAVPLHDIGGGSRASQIAFELLRRGYHVTFVNRYPSSETSDLGLRYVHQDLEQLSYDRFDPDDLVSRSSSGTVIIEAPTREFLDVASALKSSGWSVVYDLIDDWTDTSLGGDWYAADVERDIVGLADGISCSAEDLVGHIARLGREASLVPNGVNEVVFGLLGETARPADMPEGPSIIYHGSLYGSWFDWGALERVAVAFPSHSLVIIGDARGVPQAMPPNVHFLGLKAQSELGAYLTRSDVGLVPFVVSDVTHAVSPLKVYEYLASGLPVAAPPLRPLLDLSGVCTDVDLAKAVEQAMAVEKPDRAQALKDHSWGSRLRIMMATVGEDLRDVENDGAVVFTRPPTHYDKQSRWVTAS